MVPVSEPGRKPKAGMDRYMARSTPVNIPRLLLPGWIHRQGASAKSIGAHSLY